LPKLLRGFLKRSRSLFAAIGKLIFALIAEYYAEAAGRSLGTGMVSSHQTFGGDKEFRGIEDSAPRRRKRLRDGTRSSWRGALTATTAFSSSRLARQG
jgi:hypothetical protein